MFSLLMLVLTLPPNSGLSFDDPDAVVRALYARIVEARPLGIPKGEDRAALWPLLTPRLIRVLETAERCEADYYRQHPEQDRKPDFGWLEADLFSGSEEMALPAAVQVVRTEDLAPGRYRVIVQFTYRESFETYGRQPSPANALHWRGEVMVERHGRGFLIDDFRRIDGGSRTRVRALSETFVGCKGARWVGYDRSPRE